jgi:hypothetical protein
LFRHHRGCGGITLFVPLNGERRPMFLAPVTIPVLILFQAADGPLKDWKEFSPKEGGFRVLMPGEPTKKTRKLETPQGDAVIVTYSIQTRKAAFLVIRSDLPPKVDVTDAKKLLDDARDKGVKNSGGTLRDEKEIELDGHPGREMTLELPDSKVKGGGIYKTRIYLVGHAHLQVITLAPKSEANLKEINAFLDSFRLKEAGADRKKKGKRGSVRQD